MMKKLALALLCSLALQGAAGIFPLTFKTIDINTATFQSVMKVMSDSPQEYVFKSSSNGLFSSPALDTLHFELESRGGIPVIDYDYKKWISRVRGEVSIMGHKNDFEMYFLNGKLAFLGISLNKEVGTDKISDFLSEKFGQKSAIIHMISSRRKETKCFVWGDDQKRAIIFDDKCPEYPLTLAHDELFPFSNSGSAKTAIMFKPPAFKEFRVYYDELLTKRKQDYKKQNASGVDM